jgi:hypothetical protein
MADQCEYSLLVGIQSSCEAIKKVGGLDKRIYLGSIDDLDSVTLGAGNSVTSFTFKAAKGFVKYIGKREKNSAGSDIEVGENVNLRNQTLSMAVYYESAADLAALDTLIDTERVFAVVETNPGTLEVFGINKVNFSAYGLKVTANPGTSGLVLNDSTAFVPVLSGGFTNLQLIYKPSDTLAVGIAALDAQTIDGNS